MRKGRQQRKSTQVTWQGLGHGGGAGIWSNILLVFLKEINI